MRASNFFRIIPIIGVFLCGVFVGVSTTALSAGTMGSARFPDVQSGAYFDQAIGEMAEIGVIRGNPDGSFRPTTFVTRADIAVMMKRLRDEILGLDVEVRTRPERPKRTTTPATTTPPPSSTTPSAGSVRFTIDKFSVNEDEERTQITLIRTGGKDGVVSVRYTLGDGSAVAGSDYRSGGDVITFNDGETSRMFFVGIINDDVADGDEMLTITLSDPKGGLELSMPNVAILTIRDDETSAETGAGTPSSTPGEFVFSALEYGMSEAEGSIVIAIERHTGSGGSVSVDYRTSNDTARSSSDYGSANGTLTFGDGEEVKTFEVVLTDDATTEGNEKFTITLSNPTGGASIATESISITIVDDEILSFTEGEFRLKEESYEVWESADSITLTVQRMGGAKGDVTVNYETENGNAKATQDYIETRGILTFRAGESVKTITVPILQDDKRDPNETFQFLIYDPTGGATLGVRSSAVVTIRE